VQTLEKLSPKAITGLNIIMIHSDLFHFQEEFSLWLAKHELQSQFYKRFTSYFKMSFFFFFEDVVRILQN
jgi:hypothetical protein